MPLTLEELYDQTLEEIFQKTPPEKLRALLSPEQRLEGLSAEEVLRALTPEVRAALARQLNQEETALTPDAPGE